jgi:hypothetical protein
VHVVVNHLHLREPVTGETLAAAEEAVQEVVDAGALAARVIEAEPTHLILLLEFRSAEDADRVSREVGGPWMRANVVPLLARDTERSVGTVVASASAPRPGFENRGNTALLVVDVQNGVFDGAHERDTVVANVASLVEKAREERVPVVWVQHLSEQLVRGSDQWRIVPELTPADDEPRVEKTYGDSFEETTLENVLSGLGVGRLLVVGAQTDECIRSTLHGALVRGYDATLVSDAHTTEDLTAWGAPPPEQVIAHTNLYWTSQRAPGRAAGTVTTADVDFGPIS